MAADNQARPLSVLIVDDSEDDAQLVLRVLRQGAYEPASSRVDTPEAMTEALDHGSWDLVICDYSMPRFSALEALALVRSRSLDVPVIIVSGTVGEETAVGAMKHGAQDFLLKGNLTRLGPAVDRELREAEERKARRRTEEALRRSEAQLRQSQRVEAIGQLAGGVAHDFNNLLTVINSYSDMILARTPEDEPMRRELEEIRRAGDRAATLTRQLLAFSRRQILEAKVLDLNAVVLEMEKMLRRLIGEDIDLALALDPGLDRVRADPGQLEQVIMNLAVNSRDAMPRGGKLTIETANAELGEAYASSHIAVRPGAHVMLAVSDSGCGMSEEVLSRLFEPFFTTKGPGKGTGLGLSTVYGIVKQSGGNIWAYSEPGQGSTFKVYLPRAEDPQQPATKETPRAAVARGTETVLLAEDDDRVRGLARRILEMNGYKVIEANGGAEALRICEQHIGPIHLVLTDVVMPQMSGRELAERFTSLRPSTRILYMSGYTSNAIVHHGVLDPDVAFIQKPFTPDALARKVREVLGRAAPA